MKSCIGQYKRNGESGGSKFWNIAKCKTRNNLPANEDEVQGLETDCPVQACSETELSVKHL